MNLSFLYTPKHICNTSGTPPGEIPKGETIRLFTDAEIATIVIKVHAGQYTPHDLPLEVYNRIAEKLMKGTQDGFGKIYGTKLKIEKDIRFINYLQDNVYHFSGAKTYQQLRDMSAALVQDGERIPFKQFKEAATGIFDIYNSDWLRTEYNFAVGKARSAAEWSRADENSDIAPNATYITAGDDRVRPEHAELDGITAPLESDFWSEYDPPWEWGCRCTKSFNDDKVTNLSLRTLPETDPVTSFNPYYEKQVFPADHPYFTEVPKEDKHFQLMNFGLPMPEPIENE